MFKIKKNIVLLIRVTIENEQKLETFKELLAQNPNFEPYSTFTRLDKDRNGYINSSDLKDFMDFNHVFLVNRDIMDLYKLLDVNNDGKITYTDFLDSVLPRNNLKLRRLCAQRSAYYIAPYNKLPGNIEEYLAKVLKEIIESFKMRDTLIKNLMVSEDFYIRDLFNEIDSENKGFINFLDLKNFLLKNSSDSIPDPELAIFFKNLDVRNKGFINYSEFMSIFLDSGNPRLVSSGSSPENRGFFPERARNFEKNVSFSPDTSLSRPQVYLLSQKAATTAKKKNQNFDFFKPSRPFLPYKLDRSLHHSPFRNHEEEKAEKKGTFPLRFGFKIPENNENQQQDPESTFRKHKPSYSFDIKANNDKIFTPKKQPINAFSNIKRNNEYHLKGGSQTPGERIELLKEHYKTKFNASFESDKVKETVRVKFQTPKGKTIGNIIIKEQENNEAKEKVYDIPRPQNNDLSSITKHQESSQKYKENNQGKHQENLQENHQEKHQELPQKHEEPCENHDKTLEKAQECPKNEETQPNLIDSLPFQSEPRKSLEQPRITQSAADNSTPLQNSSNSSVVAAEKSNRTPPLNLKDSFSNQKALTTSNSDPSRSERMMNSLDLQLQQDEYKPFLPHSKTSEGKNDLLGGSSEINMKDLEDELPQRNKSRTVCSKNRTIETKNDSQNKDSEELIEEIDPKSLESLMSTLESFNETFKEKITTFAQPFIYLLNEEETTHEKKIQEFLDCLLLKIFNVSSIAMYLESDIKSPLFASKSAENVSQEKLESLIEITKKFMKEELFFEVEGEKGLFFYEFKRNNEKIFVLYKFMDSSEENIYYNYFRFMEKYELFNVCRHTSNFILKSLFLIHEKSKSQSVSYKSLVKYILEIKDYYLNVFKFLFFEELQKQLCFTLNTKINLLYSGENPARKRGTYTYSSILEVKPITGELRFGVPGEPVLFQLKKETCRFPEDFIAIYFEQAFSVYHKFEKEIKHFLEKSLFYEHFLENTSTVLLDFDKNGLLTFQNMEISSSLKDVLNIKPIGFVTENNQLDFSVYFWNIFTHDCPLTIKLLKMLRFRKDLKNIDSFLKELENFIGGSGSRNQEINPKSNSIQIVLRAKSGSFKGFYMLMPNSMDPNLDINSPRKRNLNQLFSKMKMVKNVQAFAFRTAAQAQKNKILKSEKMRNSILRDYVEEKDLVKYKRSKSPQVSENDLEMITKLGNVFEKIRSDRDIKEQVERKASKYGREFIPPADLFSKESQKQRSALVQGIEDVNFNVLSLELQDLHFVTWHLFDFFKFFDQFQVQLKTWQEFMWILERKYNVRKNPFHNLYHAVTVAHGCYYFSTKTVMKDFMSNLDQIALIFSGLCHDVSHTGYTNQFEINTFSKLATRYNDKSVLENHHLATTFRILQDPDKNILEKMDKDDYVRFRKIVITNILATDMKEHFTLMHNFELKIKENNYSIIKLMEQDVEKIQLYSMTVHCCDFFGNAKPFPISKTWSDKVNEEFSHQYHEEVKRNIMPTPYYKDLDINEVRFKNEFNFNKFIIQPLWHVFNKTLDDGVEDCVKNVELNVNEWENLYNKVLEEKKVDEIQQPEDKKIEEENEEEDNETDSGNSEAENEDKIIAEEKKNRLATIEAEEIEEEIEVIKQAKEEETKENRGSTTLEETKEAQEVPSKT